MDESNSSGSARHCLKTGCAWPVDEAGAYEKTEFPFRHHLVFASDEIFSKTTPIPVTVDPGGSAILRIELAESRKAEDWQRHFECLFENGMEAIYSVSDEGRGIRAGHAAVMSDVVRRTDTYHAIAHQLGSWTDRLETAAYKATEVAHACECRLDSARSGPVRGKRREAWERSDATADKAVALYEDFSYLYRCMLGELNGFDRNGNLRYRQQAEPGVEAGLAPVEELKHNRIT